MRAVVRLFTVFFFLAPLTGCLTLPALQSSAVVDEDIQPAWVNNPAEGTSASAAIHVRGRAAQEELALARAREELAKRGGVKISSEHNIQQRYSSGRMNTVTDKQISETVSGIEVKSKLKAKWIDPNSGTLWVWVVPN